MSDHKRNRIHITDADDPQPDSDAGATNDAPREQATPPGDREPVDAAGGADQPKFAAEDANVDAQAEGRSMDEVEELRRQLGELNDRYLRVSADYQNFARRSEQNIKAAREFATRDLAGSILSVMDHFEHALNVDAETSGAKAVLDGVRIVRDELIKVLESYGVSKMPVEPGEPFDPNRHEAMMRTAAEGVDSGCIVMVLQPGYMIGEKTLRPAKVSVAE